MDSNMEFLKFNRAYKANLAQVIKEKKIIDLFEQCDEALKRIKDDNSRTVRSSRRTRKD